MLSYNKKDGSFFLLTKDKEAAKEAGLTLSTRVRGPNGEHVFYTSTRDRKPEFNPYAALKFWDQADSTAKEQLAPFQKDYEMSWKNDSDQDFPCPEGKEYLPYQKAGIAYGLEKRNILIGDEPGLGKTIQAIGICNANEGKRNLVICPASIRLNWQREIRDWSTLSTLSTYPILKASHGVNPYSNYVMTSYELGRHDSIHPALCEGMWDNLIIDEAHYLKNITARRTQAVFGGGKYIDENLASRCGNIIALTGTPLPNRPRECYTLARALAWDSIDWMSFDDFCYRFNPSAMGSTKEGTPFIIEKKGRLPELQARLRCNFMIRRLKQDVLKDLPDKRYEMTYIEPTGAIREVIAKEKLLHFSLEDLKNPFAEIWGMLSTIRREMGEAKVPRVIEHIKYLLDDVEIPKVVLFAHHRSVMDALAAALHQYGVVQVRGGMSATRKGDSVTDFVNDPDVRIFLGQMDSAGFGIDGLQHVASHVVFAEPAWTPGTNEQAVDRCHRIGQHDNVLAQFLVVEGSLDERILASVLNKTHTIHESLDRRHDYEF